MATESTTCPVCGWDDCTDCASGISAGGAMGERSVRERFLGVMLCELSKYPWAVDKDRLDRTMILAEGTMNGDRKCLIDSAYWLAAWKAVGGKGKPTYKAIHAMFATAVQA